jgi:DNA-binding LacI/PurR family transcriptional regulator
MTEPRPKQTIKEVAAAAAGSGSIVGMGDFALAQFVWPAVTTVTIPNAAMAARAVDLLIDSIEGRPPEMRDVVFDTPLVVRVPAAPPQAETRRGAPVARRAPATPVALAA